MWCACGGCRHGTGHPGHAVGHGAVPQRGERPADQAAAAQDHRQHEDDDGRGRAGQHREPPRVAAGPAHRPARLRAQHRTGAGHGEEGHRADRQRGGEGEVAADQVQGQVAAGDDGAGGTGHRPRRVGHRRAGDRELFTPGQSRLVAASRCRHRLSLRVWASMRTQDISLLGVTLLKSGRRVARFAPRPGAMVRPSPATATAVLGSALTEGNPQWAFSQRPDQWCLLKG